MMKLNISVRIEASELAGAITALADAIKGPAGQVLAPATPVVPESPTPAAPAAEATPVPNPGPAPVPAPDPVPAPAPDPAPAANATPAGPTVTLEQLSHAGAALATSGKMPDLMELMKKFGVQAITQLAPEQYDAVASELRAMGAQI